MELHCLPITLPGGARAGAGLVFLTALGRRRQKEMVNLLARQIQEEDPALLFEYFDNSMGSR